MLVIPKYRICSEWWAMGRTSVLDSLLFWMRGNKQVGILLAVKHALDSFGGYLVADRGFDLVHMKRVDKQLARFVG